MSTPPSGLGESSARGLPPPESSCPTSTTTPSSIRSATRFETVATERSVWRARICRDVGVSAMRCLSTEKQLRMRISREVDFILEAYDARPTL